MITGYTVNQAFPKVYSAVKAKGRTINALKLLEIMKSISQTKYTFTDQDIEEIASKIAGTNKGTKA